MNPDAIRHYLRWLSRKWSPLPFYATFACAAALAILLLALLPSRTTSSVGVVRKTVAYTIPFLAGAALAGAIYLGTRLGSWSLLVRLEAGSERHYREVWYELMTKYRGLRPDVIDSERFRRMLLKLCGHITRHEELTPQQEQWIVQLRTLAAESPKAERRSLVAEIASMYGPQILVVAMGLVVVASLFRLLVVLF